MVVVGIVVGLDMDNTVVEEWYMGEGIVVRPPLKPLVRFLVIFVMDPWYVVFVLLYYTIFHCKYLCDWINY